MEQQHILWQIEHHLLSKDAKTLASFLNDQAIRLAPDQAFFAFENTCHYTDSADSLEVLARHLNFEIGKKNKLHEVILLAAERNHVAQVKWFEAQGVPLGFANSEGETALHSAAQSGALDVVKYLLLKGMDLNATCSLGNSPLYRSTMYGYAEITRLLLQKSADPEISENVRGQTPVFWASYHPKVLKELLQYPIELNRFDYEGDTPFTLACWIGKEQSIQQLIEYAGNSIAKQKTKSGKSAIEIAKERKHLKVEELLRNALSVS